MMLRLVLPIFAASLLQGQTDVVATIETTPDGPSIALSRAAGGLRFAVIFNGRPSATTLSRAQAEDLRNLARKLQGDMEKMRAKNFTGVIGLCEYRDNPGKYPVQIDFDLGRISTPALRVYGPGPSYREFPDRTPAELAAKLDIALQATSASRPAADRE